MEWFSWTRTETASVTAVAPGAAGADNKRDHYAQRAGNGQSHRTVFRYGSVKNLCFWKKMSPFTVKPIPQVEKKRRLPL